MHTQSIKKIAAPAYWSREHLFLDLRVGFVLSFMAIAFGLAIANISMFPPMAGIVSAVVGGLIGSIKGRVGVLICGSAAALAPFLAHFVEVLGQGDVQTGYELTLVVVCLTGVAMMLIGRFGLARLFASIFSHGVIEGMLAAIAIILLSGRLPTFSGVKLEGHDVFHRSIELIARMNEAHQGVLWLTISTFAFLTVTTLLKGKLRIFQMFPPQLFAIPVVLVLSILFGLSTEYRITLPQNPMGGLAFPDFVGAFTNIDTFITVFVFMLILCSIDTAETVATMLGIAKIDPHKREIDVDRTVGSMGLANVVSGFFGGMSNIPGGAKSTMSVTLGAKTAWTGVFCVLFTIAGVLLGREVINLLPQSGLAAIIVFTVLRLAAPAVWMKFYKHGPDQLVVFAVTFFVSAYHNDILPGLAAGVLVQFAILIGLAAWAGYNGGSFTNALAFVWKLWTEPNVRVELNGKTADLHLCDGWLYYRDSLKRVMAAIPADVERVRLHIGSETTLIDAPTMETLRAFASEQGIEIRVCSESVLPLAPHGTCIRRKPRRPAAVAS